VSLHIGDVQVTHWISHEVMRAFGPPKPFPGALVRHLNDIPGDNRIDNLAWGNQTDNMQDAIANGRDLGGYRLKGFRKIDMVEWSDIYDI
jgi:hypothetical protein